MEKFIEKKIEKVRNIQAKRGVLMLEVVRNFLRQNTNGVITGARSTSNFRGEAGILYFAEDTQFPTYWKEGRWIY